MLVMVIGEVPRFFSVAFSIWFCGSMTLPKLSGLGVKPILVPMPESATTCGLPGSLSVMVRVPVRLPVAVGVKTTLMLQERTPGLGGGRN